MAYTTYTTRALVCGSVDRNTADRSYRLFTERAGMLFASARSVRNERSRQRYGLQDFSLVRTSLIKGKHGWRIGSVEPLGNYYQTATDKAARGSVVRVVRLLRRFVSGEAPEPHLFQYLTTILPELGQATPAQADRELIVLVHCLHLLGYVSPEAIPSEIPMGHLAATSLPLSDTARATLTHLYDTAVDASHL